jgi:hypothetical protein
MELWSRRLRFDDDSCWYTPLYCNRYPYNLHHESCGLHCVHSDYTHVWKGSANRHVRVYMASCMVWVMRSCWALRLWVVSRFEHVGQHVRCESGVFVCVTSVIGVRINLAHFILSPGVDQDSARRPIWSERDMFTWSVLVFLARKYLCFLANCLVVEGSELHETWVWLGKQRL